MTRCNLLFAALAAVTCPVLLGAPQATAQNEAVLAEVYGEGVHAYYAGRYDEAFELLSSVIDAGTKDPRPYYFRGIIAHQQGRPMEAQDDWRQGAELEAGPGGGAPVGRSLSRFQGSARLELEKIRRQARMEAMKTANQRSNTRLQQLGVEPSPNPGANARQNAPARPAPAQQAPTQPAPGNGNATPPPAAPAAPVAGDPFADDGPGMVAGEPQVESQNALEGADGNPFKDDPAPAAAEAPADAGGMGGDGGNPFGEAAPAGGGSDPFGGDDGSDPFGGGSSAPADDPFGGDPFGN